MRRNLHPPKAVAACNLELSHRDCGGLHFHRKPNLQLKLRNFERFLVFLRLLFAIPEEAVRG
jgi:hypothetical protein